MIDALSDRNPYFQVGFMRNVMSSDQLKEDRMALENLLLNLPQNKPGKSSSLEMTPYNTPQLSPATTPANKKNRLPIGEEDQELPSYLCLAWYFKKVPFVTVLGILIDPARTGSVDHAQGLPAILCCRGRSSSGGRGVFEGRFPILYIVQSCGTHSPACA